MKTFLVLAQIIFSILLITLILLQAKGTGLGTVFGGEGTFYRTKRGAEKLFYYATITVALIFFLLSLTLFFIKK
ncbi:MAG: preprotein translocase subunit SecG [Candidatus Woykebacteria bacterium RBG_13_40_7b]|uniref:Protein-export membrane protein SecG n=1 Tax=Candidatus Woykebacteria bacterium RBG_13_40_7b TaxID=1802594 RepID=A0A1G1W9I6_9BACT|nr:MAG: preprotein translocase subunit SecG [Candidatus Woykebacteria bacterium RBG_13_40_7b]